MDSESDGDDCEDWERFEALHDDPHDVERNKERKYEEEQEIGRFKLLYFL